MVGAVDCGWTGFGQHGAVSVEIDFAVFEIARSLRSQSAFTGKELAEALRVLWHDLNIEQQLQTWEHPEQNATVWQQMVNWLDDVELAFDKRGEMDLREWLPILEAGLSGADDWGDSAGAGPSGGGWDSD